MDLTCQQLVFSSDELEEYLFSGEKSQNLNAICTAAPETVMPTGDYRVIDGEFFRVEEGSLPEVCTRGLAKEDGVEYVTTSKTDGTISVRVAMLDKTRLNCTTD